MVQRKRRAQVASSGSEADGSDSVKPESATASFDQAQHNGNHMSQDDDEEEEDELEEDTGRPGKRRRLPDQVNGAQRAQAAAGALDSEEDVKDEEEEIKPYQMPKRIRDKDGFQEGAVVRVKCHNFLTYTDTEVYPGAYLNMIIGPNGTGKSTICSAISIALGTKAKTLKRHDKVSAMVKYGAKKAFVEVELKGKPGQRNTIIRREINSENDKSVWKLNNSHSTEDEVGDAVQALNIQTDNRVCYLPQELVYEFAKLSGPELLRATERSAGHRDLPTWHDQLVDVKHKWITTVADLNTDRELLTREEDMQQRSRREEERLRERDKVQQELNFLTAFVPYRQYHERKTQWDQFKAVENQAKRAFKDLKKELEPLEQGQSAQKIKLHELAQTAKSAKLEWDSLEANRRRAQDQIRNAETRTSDLRSRVESLTSSEKQRKENISKAQRTIRQLEEQVSGGPPPESDISIERAALEQISVQRRQLKEEYATFQERQTQLARERDEAELEKHRAQEHLQQLADSSRQREEKLRNSENLADRQLYQALQWIRQNKSRFSGKVYDPVCLAITPTQPRYARYLDSVIRDTTARAILVENAEDYQLLSRTFNNKKRDGGMELRINLSQVDERTPQLATFQKPWSPEQLASHGFDTWALDLAQGPEEVLRFLCNSANLHTIPVALDDNRAIDEGRIQTPQNNVRRYVAQGVNTVFNFSRYGRRSVFANSSKLKNQGSPYIVFSSGVNEEAIQSARMEIEQRTQAVADCHRRLVATEPEEREFRQRSQTLDGEKNRVMAERQRKENAMAQYSRAVTQLAAARRNLEGLQTQPSKEEERKQLLNHLKAQAVRRFNLVKELQHILGQQTDARIEQSGAELAVLHAQANCEALSAEQNERNTLIREAKKESDKAAEASKAAHAEASAALNEYRAVFANYESNFEADRDAFTQQHPDMSLDEVEEMKENKEAELSAAPEISPEVVRQIHERDARIKTLRESLEKKDKANRKIEAKIRNLEAKYKPIMKSVVAEINDKFASAFSDIGCLGEVQLYDEDVDPQKWAIKILVSFRKGTEMVELSGQRQSGGERSLSTIMYFISLTKVSTAPFSLVDEINQGMDARNERAILDLLVKCTCEEDASQYFLITPKLLPHLRYHEKMKVLCIHNGDWLPDEGFSPKAWLKDARKKAGKPMLQAPC